MKTKQLIVLMNIVFTIVLLIVIAPHTVKARTHNKKVVSQYYSPTQAVYERKFLLDQVDYTRLTHFNYGPLRVTDECEVTSANHHLDYTYEYPSYNTKGHFATLKKIKNKYTPLKVILTVGGTEYSTNLIKCSKKEETRKQMIKDVVKLVQKYDFDGVDYDWVFPENEVTEDKHDYVYLKHLVKETREYVQDQSEHKFIITVTGTIDEKILEKVKTIVPEIVEKVNYINLMSFEYSGLVEDTYVNAPLYCVAKCKDFKNLNINSTVELYKQLEVPLHKIVIGIAAYGRGATKTKGLYKKKGKDFDVAYTTIKNKYLTSNQYTSGRVGDVPYIYNERKKVFISYDDKRSVEAKTEYVYQKGLAGVFVYQTQDDVESELIHKVVQVVRNHENHDREDGSIIDRLVRNFKHKININNNDEE